MERKEKLTKIVKEVISELSPETRQSAIQKMKDKGQDRRADKWTQHYGTKNLEKFKGTTFLDQNGTEYEIRHFKVDGDKLLISFITPNRQYNVGSGTFTYNIKTDTYNIHWALPRKTVRTLSTIAQAVNPETQYKSGTGDFKVKEY